MLNELDARDYEVIRRVVRHLIKTRYPNLQRDYDDAVQEAATYMLLPNKSGQRRIDTFDPSRASRKSWLSALTSQAVQTFVRDRSRAFRQDLAVEEAVQTELELASNTLVEDPQATAVARKVLEGMSELDREVVRLRGEDWTFREIGAAYNHGEAWARAKYKAAISHARKAAHQLGIGP